MATAAFACALAGCGGGGGGGAAPTPAPAPAPAPTLSVSAADTQVLAGAKALVLTATANASAGNLSWSLGAGSPGSLSASSGTSVNYLPPAAAAVTAITPVTVNVSGTGIAKSFSLTLYPEPGAPGLSLIAGDIGGYGQFDAAGTAARFQPITAVATDADGNALVATAPAYFPSNVALRKVSAGGVVSTIVDTPRGYADGALANAAFGKIGSVAAGADGAIFVLDGNGIRRISQGTVTTVTTTFKSVDDNGSGIVRIVPDGAGGLYVMERTRISRMSANGAISSFAGSAAGTGAIIDGQGSAAEFVALRDIAIDPAGTLYVLDSYAVRTIGADARVTTLAGSTSNAGAPLDGGGTLARFKAPSSLAADAAGNVLVLDDTLATAPDGQPFKSLRQVTSAGQVSTVKTGLTDIGAVRIDAAGRSIFASKADLSLSGAGNALTPFAGMRSTTWGDVDGKGEQARLNSPYYIAADALGALYVVELNSSTFSADGGRPFIDQSSGLRLRKIATDGTVATLAGPGVWWGKAGTSTVEMTVPNGIAIDRQGNLYISETSRDTGFMAFREGGGSIVKITPDGVASVFAGMHNQRASQGGQVDGTGTAARFVDGAKVLGFDADGNLYVDDGKIRKITPEQVVTTVAALPAGFGADAQGNTYVRDAETVVRVAADGTRTVVAGTPGLVFNQLGPLPGKLVNYGTGIVRTGPASFALTSGGAIVRLVLPH